jgi:tape measure domain-containing protein
LALNVGSIFSDFVLNSNPFEKGMQRVQEVQARALGQMQSRAAGASNTLGGLQARLEQLNNRLDRTAIGSRNFDILKQKIAETQAQIQKAQSGMGGFGDTLQRMGSIIRGSFVVAGVAGLAKMGMELEQTEVQFEVFLKSAEKAKQLLGELKKFADESPFENMDAIQAGKSLLAAGVAADQITGKLRMLGDIASGSNVPIQELAQIFAKMKTTDIIQAEELNQLERFGPVLSGMADSMGMSMRDLKQKASEGKVSFADLEKAMQKMTSEGGTFFGMMDKQAQTAGGKWSTMMGTIEGIGQKIGYLISEALKPLLDVGNMVLGWIDSMAESVKAWYQDLDPAQQKIMQIIVVLGALGVAAATLGPQIMVLGGTIVKAIQGATAAMAANPILLAVMAIVAGVILMTATFQRWKSVFDPVIAQGNKLRNSLVPTMNKIMQAVDFVRAKLALLMKGFSSSEIGKAAKEFSVLTLAVRAIGAVFALVVNSVIGGFQLIVDGITLVVSNLQMWWDVLVAIKDGVAQLFSDPLNVDAWSEMGAKFASNMQGHFAKVGQDAQNLVNNVGDHIKSQGDIMLSIVAQPKIGKVEGERAPFAPGREPPPSRTGEDVRAIQEARKQLVDAWKNANKETFEAIGAAEVLLRNNTVESIGSIHKAITAANIPAQMKQEFESIVAEFFESTNDGASNAVQKIRETLRAGGNIDSDLATRAMPGIVEALKKNGAERSAALESALKNGPLSWSMTKGWQQQVQAQLQAMDPIVLKTDADTKGAKERLIAFLRDASNKTRIPMTSLIGFDPKDVSQLNKFVDAVAQQRGRILEIDKEISDLRSAELSDSETLGTLQEQELQREIDISGKLREKQQIQAVIRSLAIDAAQRQSQEIGLREYMLRLEKEIAIARRTGNTKEAEEKSGLLAGAKDAQSEKFKSIVGNGILEPLDDAIAKFGEIDAAAKDLSFSQIFAAKANVVAGAVNGMIQSVGAIAKQFADAYSKLVEVAQQKFARKFEIGSYFVDLFQRYEQQKLQEQIDLFRETEDAKIAEVERGAAMRKVILDKEFEDRKAQLEQQKLAEMEALRLDYEAKLAKLHAESADKEQAMIADDLMAADFKAAKEALEKEHADRLAQLATEINGKKETDKKASDDKIAQLEKEKNTKLDELEKDKTAKEKANKKQQAQLKWLFESMTMEMGKQAQIQQLKVQGITGAAQAMAGAMAALAPIPFVGPFLGMAMGAKLASMIMSATNTAVGLVSRQFVLPSPEALGLATGGVLRGPGGPTDDLIPARLSNREAVIDAGRTTRLLGAADNITKIANNADRITAANAPIYFHEGAIQFFGVGDLDETKMAIYSRRMAQVVERYR